METIEILLVENNPGDVRLTQEALKESSVATHLSVVTDGEAAIAFLRQQGPYAQPPRPNLILLDLNLPKKSGFELLTEIKADPQLRTIPVVVLTSSSRQEDILRAYDLQASSYVTKPSDLDEFTRAVKSVGDFCLIVARVPPRE